MAARRRPMTLKQMRGRVDSTIAELNAAQKKPSDRLRVAWGAASKEEEDRLRKTPATKRSLPGLLTFDDPDTHYFIDIDVFATPVRLDSSACLVLRRCFEDGGIELPRDNVRDLFNIIWPLGRGCGTGPALDISPNDDPSPEILVWGVESYLNLNALTGRILDFAIWQLIGAADTAESILDGEAIDAGDDHWTGLSDGPE